MINLLQSIETYQPFDEREKQHQQETLRLLREEEDCLDRSLMRGHLTASAIILSPDLTQILLHEHLYLKAWYGFGGHADGNPDLQDVAYREALEESGIQDLELFYPHILDIDVHPIPENPKKGEGDHLHHDVTYLYRVPFPFTRSHGPEGARLKWIPIQTLALQTPVECYVRIQKKIEKLLL